MSITVIGFITLDGFMTDPDGSDGTPTGGWAFRHGHEAVAGDKFEIGGIVKEGAVLMGRETWQLFARLLPGRDDPFSTAMNTASKLVASRTLTDASGWANSEVIDGDLRDAMKREQRDVVVVGSLSVVHALMEEDLVDEYRLMTFPTVLGTGERLFPDGGVPTHLECLEAKQSGPTIIARYGRAA